MARAESGRPATTTPRRGRGRAVDSPVFWWSAAVVFLVNAALTAGEDRWLIALLQILTAVWAFVAGATASERRRSGRDSPE
jgi:hypothetical protein